MRCCSVQLTTVIDVVCLFLAIILQENGEKIQWRGVGWHAQRSIHQDSYAVRSAFVAAEGADGVDFLFEGIQSHGGKYLLKKRFTTI